MKLFISYSHADSRFVRKLVADLSKRGFEVWLDERTLNVGDSIAEKIRSGIDACDYFIPIISPESIASPWVRRELDVAMNLELEGKLRKLLPVLIRGVELPSLLGGRLYANFKVKRGYGDGLASILRALDHDSARVNVLAGSILRSANISKIARFLATCDLRATSIWEPAATQVEVTGGYLTHLRGLRKHGPGKAGVHSPISPIPLADGSPMMSDGNTQVCFARMRVNHFDDDVIESQSMRIYFPTWRYIIYFLGLSDEVKELVGTVCDYSVSEQVPSLRYDLPDVLTWWDSPTIPSSPPIMVEVSGIPARPNLS